MGNSTGDADKKSTTKKRKQRQTWDKKEKALKEK